MFYPQVYLLISYERIDKSEGIDLNKSKESIKCIICRYYYFKSTSFKYQSYVCNGCHNFSMGVMNLRDFFIWNIKGVNYKVYAPNISKQDAVNILRSFKPNLTPIQVIKKIAFGGTYFRYIYSGVNDKFYKNSWKEIKKLEDIDKKYYASGLYDVSVNKYGVKCETSLRFLESKNRIRPIDPYGWFQWYFRYWKGRRSEDNQRQIDRSNRLVSRFKTVLIKMIGDGRDSPKIRQVLLHWGYELK